MRAFQIVSVAVAVATSYGEFYGSTYGNTYGIGAGTYGSSYGGSYGSGYNYAPASYGASYSTGYNYAPATYGASYSTGFNYAPSYAVGASYSAAPVAQVHTIAAAPAATVKSHEIHTGSGRQAIRIEDFQSGDQVIRVHEGQQAPPQIAQVQVPGEQHHIRVVNHQSGPAQIERVVHRQQTQVVDVQKPGRPGARIVQVVKGESPAPSVEFVNAGGSNHHVYHANEAAGHGASYAPVAVSGTSYAPVAISGASYAPATYGASYGSYGYGSTYSSPISYGTSYGSSGSYLAAPATSVSGVHYGTTGTFGNTGYGSTAVIAKA